MKSGNRSNALLVELLVVLLFFMLSSAILLQLFAAGRNQSAKAELLSEAASCAQNVAEQLYHTQDAPALLTSLGFSAEGDVWTRSDLSWQMQVTLSTEEAGIASMRRQEVRVLSGEELLLSLPCSVYEG